MLILLRRTVLLKPHLLTILFHLLLPFWLQNYIYLFLLTFLLSFAFQVTFSPFICLGKGLLVLFQEGDLPLSLILFLSALLVPLSME